MTLARRICNRRRYGSPVSVPELVPMAVSTARDKLPPPAMASSRHAARYRADELGPWPGAKPLPPGEPK